LRDCKLGDLDDLFGLQSIRSNSTLDEWLESEVEISETERLILREFQERLLINRDGWNEQELAMGFIGPVLSLANFTEPYRFNLFSQRRIKAIIPGLEEDVELSGEPDGMIATGYRTPKVPMFAFTEYKRLLESEGDPAGQTVAAMLVGQRLDSRPKPLYGSYVIGHDWYFLVLEGKRYTISLDFSALTAEIFDIFRILKALKLIILDLVPSPS